LRVAVSHQVLTKEGFASKARPRRGNVWVSDTTAVTLKRQQKLDKLQKTTQDLIVAWGLSLLCGLGHIGHVWPAAPAWVHALHHPVLAATMSAAALLGPGRDIISSGWQALSAGRPDMNSLVGLGATASFAVSCVAAALPALRWKTFFEEPAMLLGELCELLWMGLGQNTWYGLSHLQ
jgi:Cu2+-exporting ATPase